MDILDAIGNTSMVRLRRVVPANGATVLAKLEWENPTGSMKDRMAQAVISRAEADGRLRPGDTVVEYTEGSTGTSLALVCAAKGYRIRIVTSEAFSQEKRGHMAALGAELALVPSEGGLTTKKLILDMIEVARGLSRQPHTFWSDQLNNHDAVAGYFALGEEIWSQTRGQIDAFVHSVGTAASLRGVATALKQHKPGIRIVAVEPAESPVLRGGPPGPHKIEGVGIGYTPPLWDPSLVDDDRRGDGRVEGAERAVTGRRWTMATRGWAVLGLLVPLLIGVHSAPGTTSGGASVSPPGAAAPPSPASSASPASFYTVTPCRLVDTRTPAGPVGGPALAANATRTFPVFGLCGIPSSATAIAANLTAVDETGSGHLRVYAAGGTPPGTSTINFVPGTTRANNAVVSLGVGGQISVLCGMATGRTHFVLDVTGYFAAGPVRPVVTASDTGTMLVLQTDTPTEIVRVGLLKSWGGAITEVSLNGTDYVNDDDPGRQIQTSLWDGSGNYGTSWGYNPVESGDHFYNGSPLLASTLGPDSIYTRTQPLQWAPENFGGGWDNPVLGDAYIEKWVSVVPGFNRVFKVHYRITHFGTDAHSTAGQEAPVMYVNPNVPRFLYYEGSAPWTNGALSQHTMPFACCDSLRTSERWGAYVDGTDTGIALYTPGQYPNSKGFNAGSTLQFTPLCPYTWDPGAVLEFDTFILVGPVTESRAAIYALQSQQSGPSPFTAVGYLDVPASGDVLSGTAIVHGWAWALNGVVAVDVFVDGNQVGAATYGVSRPDIPIALPGAPSNAAYQYSLDTRAFPNGSHTVVAKATDGAGRVATFVTKQVTFSN